MLPARSASLEVPVFAVPHDGDLGCGDTRGVKEVIDLAAELGFQRLTLLPNLETIEENDPFRALSLYALDPILLEVSPSANPDLTQAAYDRLTSSATPTDADPQGALAYKRVKKLKLDLLWQAFTQFWDKHFKAGTTRAAAYHRFCREERRWLPDYCLFRLLMDFEEGSATWAEWSHGYESYHQALQFLARIAVKKPEAVERQLAFYAYVQWLADVQWRAVQAHAGASGIGLITDLKCTVSPDCADHFRFPEQFQVEMLRGREVAVCRQRLLGHLESRLRRLSNYFDSFRILDFRRESARTESDQSLKAFLNRLPGPEHNAQLWSPTKVEWESLPSMAMRSTQLWPAPNGQMTPPDASTQMTFSSFGSPSLRRLWSHDARFRTRLRSQWSVNPEEYDQRTALSLIRKLFHYPACDVQIAYADLAGLENDPDAALLERYETGPQELRRTTDWDTFSDGIRKILRQTSRTPIHEEKAVESV